MTSNHLQEGSDWEKEFETFIEEQIFRWENQGRDEGARWGVRNFWTGFAPQTFKEFIRRVAAQAREEGRAEALKEAGTEIEQGLKPNQFFDIHHVHEALSRLKEETNK